MVDDFLLVEDGNRSAPADTQDLSAVNVKEKVACGKYFDRKILNQVGHSYGMFGR